MKQITTALLVSVALTGCRTYHAETPLTLDTPAEEKAIYAALKVEPTPIPKATPYDRNREHRQVFEEGFRAGWDCAVSGALLHGTYGIPPDVPKEKRNAWSDGWGAGAKAGSERWLSERQSMQERIGHPVGEE
jgi:hypothetical protein